MLAKNWVEKQNSIVIHSSTKWLRNRNTISINDKIIRRNKFGCGLRSS